MNTPKMMKADKEGKRPDLTRTAACPRIAVPTSCPDAAMASRPARAQEALTRLGSAAITSPMQVFRGGRSRAASPGAFVDDGPTATLVRQVLGAVAQFDKAMTVAKLRLARERKRKKQGKCEGRKITFGGAP